MSGEAAFALKLLAANRPGPDDFAAAARVARDAQERIFTSISGNMKRQHFTSGTPWEEQAAYSQAVRVGSFVFVSGTTASNSDGSTAAPGNPYEQTRIILRKIELALAQLGARLADVVRTRMFVVDIEQWQEVARAHQEVFAGINPAATLVEVRRLINADHLIEIEADAVIQEGANQPGHTS